MHLSSIEIIVNGDELHIHPTIWVEWSRQQLYAVRSTAFCFANVVVTAREDREDLACLLPHELIHAAQWRALGPLQLLARYILPTEPALAIWNWSDSSSFTHGMWRPPQQWVSQWTFIAFTRSNSK